MPDILIRGMEMPKEGEKILIAADGSVWVNAWPTRGYMRMENVHAVPLPEGHGRLGDLTEVENKLQETLDGMGDRWLSSPALMAQRVAIVADLKKVKETPTIIPAEGGGEK